MKTNNLIFSDTRTVTRSNYKERTNVTIRLNDECKNGHQDFAITCDIFEQSKNGRWQNVGGGAAHDHILKLFPKYKIFVDLHLCDYSGAPMHAAANGYYHLKNEPTVLRSYGFTDQEIQYFLTNCEDAKHFNYMLEKGGMVKRWKVAAEEAIKVLEGLTGKTFVNDSQRSQYTPLTSGQRVELETKIKEGYYTPEKVQERKNLRAKKARAKKRIEVKAECEKRVNKAKNALIVKLFMIDNSPVTNYIYYDHSNTINFNWLSYEKEISPEQFKTFVSLASKSKKLPEGVKFQIDKK